MDCLCAFLKEKEFVTSQEIYEEYMSKPKGGGGGTNYNDDGRWGIIRLTKQQLGWFLKTFPCLVQDKYLLCNYYRNIYTEKKYFWALTDDWELDLKEFKNKLAKKYNVKSMKKYHQSGGKERYAQF
jgi:hypothetical protein